VRSDDRHPAIINASFASPRRRARRPREKDGNDESASRPRRYCRAVAAYPKIELHVHLEGTVRTRTLKEIAKGNDSPLPDDVHYRGAFRDFRHVIDAFEVRMGVLRRYEDFRRVVVEYAAEAATHGAKLRSVVRAWARRLFCVLAVGPRARGRSLAATASLRRPNC
jgi:hypothetical protein